MIENDNTWLNLNTPAYCWLFNDSITNTLNKYGAILNVPSIIKFLTFGAVLIMLFTCLLHGSILKF
jgi:hypothetical protein